MKNSLLFFALLCSCNSAGNKRENNEITAGSIINKSLDAVGDKVNRDGVRNIVAFANCVSPKGNYTTEIHTSSEGYSFFKQVYSFNPQSFEARIRNKAYGFQIGDSTKALSKEAVFTIRSHEFYNLILDVQQRFREFTKPEDVLNEHLYKITGKDELEHPCALFFDKQTALLKAIHLQNPENEKDLLITTFSDWKKIEGLQLPTHISIDQSGKKYSFDFIKIDLNSREFEKNE